MQSKTVGTFHLTKLKSNTHVNLLFLSIDGGNNHYCLIKDLSNLVTVKKLNITKNHILVMGLQFFTSPKTLNYHERNDCIFLCMKLPLPKIITNKLHLQ